MFSESEETPLQIKGKIMRTFLEDQNPVVDITDAQILQMNCVSNGPMALEERYVKNEVNEAKQLLDLQTSIRFINNISITCLNNAKFMNSTFYILVFMLLQFTKSYII